MKRRAYLLAWITTIISLSEAHAGKLVLADVPISLKPLGQGEFALHVQFPLNNLPGNINPQTVAIDYVELAFEVQVLTPVPRGQLQGRSIEVLASAADGKTPLPNLAYNSHPAIGRFKRAAVGTEEVRFDVSEIVVLWLKGGVSNEGVLLLSHRQDQAKALSPNAVTLLRSTRATVTIFYTVDD